MRNIINSKKILITIIAFLCVITYLFISTKTEPNKKTIGIAIQYDLPKTMDYTTLDTDTEYKTTFGMINKYSVSTSIEDGYAIITKKYGGLEKAKNKIETNENMSLDGYLFTNYLLSYLGGASKNIGIPNSEETITLNNGEWIHYYDFPKKENGDAFEVYMTWNNGLFYYIELAYQGELNEEIINYISNAKLNDGNGYIPK